ncbi:hypothetical protein BU16DRAFT_566244 [Lophium mytilinum]|uniref:F-box domain-containing protein n=1 Tax=Lophium mytilinum TaxID=390894 RepID=A0A6A6QF21_9PEZI|nr:hypothetical protein BU16DRAFT_566244 [Lophium mytilinum]
MDDIQQNGPIPSLPPELLHTVCNYLDVPTLKSFRLASKTYNEIAIPHLFSEAYLRPTISSYTRLHTLLTKGPHCAKYIKSLDCVAEHDLCPSGAAHDIDWESALHSPVGFIHSMNRYYEREMRQELDSSFIRGAERQVEREMLLERAEGDPSSPYYQHYEYLAATDRENYPPEVDQLENLVSLMKRMAALESIKFSETPNRYGEGSTFFNAVYMACFAAGVKLKQVEALWTDVAYRRFSVWGFCWLFGNENMGRFMWQWALNNFTSIRFDLSENRDDQNSTINTLRVLPNLQSLTLARKSEQTTSSYEASFMCDFGQVLEDLQLSNDGMTINWPRLQHLSLAWIAIKFDALLGFLKDHDSSLKFLDLERVALDGGSWLTALPEFREWIASSQLQRVTVRGTLIAYTVDLDEGQIHGDMYDWRFPFVQLGQYGEAQPVEHKTGLNLPVIDYLMKGGEFPFREKSSALRTELELPRLEGLSLNGSRFIDDYDEPDFDDYEELDGGSGAEGSYLSAYECPLRDDYEELDGGSGAEGSYLSNTSQPHPNSRLLTANLLSVILVVKDLDRCSSHLRAGPRAYQALFNQRTSHFADHSTTHYIPNPEARYTPLSAPTGRPCAGPICKPRSSTNKQIVCERLLPTLQHSSSTSKMEDLSLLRACLTEQRLEGDWEFAQCAQDASMKRDEQCGWIDSDSDSDEAKSKSKPAYRPVNIPVILPELLHMICNYLDVPTLKAFRRASSAYNTIAITHLFSEACLKDNMASFDRLLTLVTKGSQFAQHVKSLEFVSDPSIHLEAADLFKVIDATIEHVKHQRPCEDPRGLWIEGVYRPCLIDLIEGLPGLESVKFSEVVTEITCRSMGWRAQDFFKGIQIACRCSSVEFKTLEASMTTSVFESQSGSFFDRWERPIRCWYGSINPTPLNTSTLTTIDFKIIMTLADFNRRFIAPVGAIQKALIKMPNLRDLRLSFKRCRPAAEYRNMPTQFERFIHPRNEEERFVWLKLERLSLTWMGMDADFMLRFLDGHQDLKVLELEHVMLTGSTWRWTLPQLHQLLSSSAISRLSFKGKLLEGFTHEEALVNPDSYPYSTIDKFYGRRNLYQLDRLGSQNPVDDDNSLNVPVTEYLMHGGDFPLRNPEEKSKRKRGRSSSP